MPYHKLRVAINFQSLLGCNLEKGTMEIALEDLTFNPFWDATYYHCRGSENSITTFNPFWDATSLILNIHTGTITFNPFWDATKYSIDDTGGLLL